MHCSFHYYAKTILIPCIKKLIECSNILQLPILLFIASYFNHRPGIFVSFSLETGI